jgi:hypothetical protein
MIGSLVKSRVRGFRVIDLVALVVFLALALTVYSVKTFAGRERADIADIESDIQSESARVRLLKGEIAHLESPDRLERLAVRYAGQAPVVARQEITPEQLPGVLSPPAGGSTAEGGEGGMPTSADALHPTPSTAPLPPSLARRSPFPASGEGPGSPSPYGGGARR